MRQSTAVQMPASKPRNIVIRALIGLRGRTATRRHAATVERRRRQLEQLDVDQRVREVGEW